MSIKPIEQIKRLKNVLDQPPSPGFERAREFIWIVEALEELEKRINNEH